MLAYCLEDGLTVGDRVYRKGELFRMSDVMVREYGELSDDKLNKKQKRVYNKILFRRPTPEEFRLSFIGKQIKLQDLSDKEKKVLATALQTRKSKEDEAIKNLSSSLLDDKALEEAEAEAVEEVSEAK